MVARAGGDQLPTVELLGVRVAARGLDDVARAVIRWATAEAAGPLRYVCATSVHGLVEGARDPSFRAILNRAACVTPDGMPLVWLGRWLGARAMSRVYGPALLWEVCRLTAGLPVRHFFYGAGPGVALELARRLEAAFPGLQVAGTYSPPYGPLTDAELTGAAAAINASGAHIVWVGLSTPKQERWVDAIRDRLQVRVAVTVGAAFDFHAGRVRQAPGWMQRAGLEWLFRLSQEPRRLWRRYARNNPMFVWLALLQLAGMRKFTVNEVE
jgi:N-acetylglucosaminyldiphosphoundecaprenol N-acetyl-beta-D-mannosaminyltransferase